MSEAYACDRCGKLRDGSAYAYLDVMGGRPRTGPREERQPEFRKPPESPLDLCRSCINDLRKWYADGGGDRSDISGDWLNDADAVESEN